MTLVELATVDDDDVKAPPVPASSTAIDRLRLLEGTVADLVSRLNRRTRRLRAALVEVDLALDLIRAELAAELARAERVATLEEARTRRGALSLVNGEDGFLYVGLGGGALGRVAVEGVVV